MKNFLAITLAVLLIFAMIGCKKQEEEATDAEESNNVAATNVYEDFEYDVNEDGELEITNYNYTGKDLANVVIPGEINGRSIVGIGKEAFKAHKNIASVTFPESILYIDEYAFADCDYITEINLPKNLTNIEAGAFADCAVLKKVTFSDTLLSIGVGAFKDCAALENFTLPASLLTIEESAFWGCSSLTSVTIPNNIIDLGDGAFYLCTKLIEVNLLGDAGTDDAAILAKMNAVLSDADTTPETIKEVETILAEEGLMLGTLSDRGAKFVWDVSDNKIYGAFTENDKALLTAINAALEGQDFTSMEIMISTLKTAGVYVNDLNTCVASDKFVWDKTTNEFTTVYAGVSVFDNCTPNTTIAVTENSFFADFAEAKQYIAVIPANAPEDAKTFSDNTLRFYYPATFTKEVDNETGVVSIFANDIVGLSVSATERDLLDDHLAWTPDVLDTFLADFGDAATNKALTQTNNANGVAFTKITFDLVNGDATLSCVVDIVTVGNTTYQIEIVPGATAEFLTMVENSFADIR